MIRTSILVSILLVAPVFVPGCGGTDPLPPGPDVNAILAEGWAAFEAGDLDLATARFDSVLVLDATRWEAHVGHGWVGIRRRDMTEAVSRFETATQGESSPRLDAHSGLALSRSARGEWNLTIEEGELVLDAAPSYLFPHDPEYGSTDVRWLVAKAALDVADYERAAAHLEILAPGSGLDPEAATFPEDALALLESLRPSV